MLIRSGEVRKRPEFYNEENRHCDIETCFDVLKENDFGFVHQVLTFTREHAGAETSFSARFGTDYLGSLEVLIKYGKTYLSENEYEQCLRSCWMRYYAFLGAKVFQAKDKGFWDFHRNALARLGYPIRVTKVAKAAGMDVLDLVFNPLKTSMRIARRISRHCHSSE
jgi:hypothetical protein